MKNNLIFNCHEISILVSRSLDEDLPLLQRLAVKFHLLVCKMCSVNRKHLLKLKDLTKLFKKHGQESVVCCHLSAESKNKLKDLLNNTKQ